MSVSVSFRIWSGKKDPFFEAIILNCNRYQDYFAGKAVEYCRKVLNSPWPEAEALISDCPVPAYKYSRFVLGKPWKKGEEAISKYSYASYLYSRFVIKDRFKIGENAIKKDTVYSYLYAKNVIKDRFPEAESHICNHYYAADYAVRVMKKRWKKIEDYILEHSNLNTFNSYIEMLRGKDRIDFHNKIMAREISRKETFQSWNRPTYNLWVEKFNEGFLRNK